jgi:cytochrome c biogenesis protein ResB
VERHEATHVVYVFAERGRWVQASSLVGHLAAILLVLAVAARPALSWQSIGVTLLPGQEYTLELFTPVTLRAGELQVDFYPDGQPSDYRVPLAVVEGSSIVTETVGLNQPLTHRGLAIHLVGYGLGGRVSTPEGFFDLTFQGGQAEEVVLAEAGLSMRVAPQPGGDALFVEVWDTDGLPLGSGIVASGQQVRAGAATLTFEPGRFTVWQLNRDPTFEPAVGAACLMLLAMLASLWVPQRRIWLRLGKGSVQMVGSGDMDWEFEALASAMAAMLQSGRGASHG